jgi:alpha-2-macroglobulin
MLRQVINWLREDRRRMAAAAVVTVAAAALGSGGIYLSSTGGGGPAPTQTSAPGVCNEPTLIDAPASGGPADWQHVQAPSASGCFSLTAANSDASGVAPDTSFNLEALEAQDAAQLASRIQVEPAVELKVEAVSNDQTSSAIPSRASYSYRVTPAAPLGEGKVYKFTLLDSPGGQPIRSWAFETQSPLRVVATLPADQATAVPINIGIELTFSADGVTGVEQHFQIDPPVEGRFEIHKRVAVFVPTALAKETLYTVTLKSGVSIPGSNQTIAQDFRLQFETGSSDRAGETPGQAPIQFSRRAWESSTQEAPAVALFGQDIANASSLPFTVYQFAGPDDFMAALNQFSAVPSWAIASRSRFTIDTSGLGQVTSFDGAVHTAYQSDSYVQFPDKLPAGMYLVQAVYQNQPLQTLLQVTDVAAYVSVSRTQTLVWANDLATQGPLAGAALSGPSISETTDGTGVAVFSTPSDLVHLNQSDYGYTTTDVSGNLTVKAADGRELVVPLADIFNGYQYYGFREYNFQGDPSLYWRFIYTDRHLYHPGDSIHFWGLARLRENAPASQEITVQLSGTNYTTDGVYQPVLIAQTTVSTDDIGAYIGEMSFQGVSPGFYQLQAQIGDQVISSTDLEVRDFTNPAYKIDVLPEKNALIAGDTMNVLIRASFFDGTPVPNLALIYRDGKDADTTLTTDERGEASVAYTAAAPNGGPYSGASLTVVPANAEEGEITGSAWVLVMPAALVADANAAYSSGQGIVTGTIYNLDLSRINSGNEKDYNDYRGTPAPGRTVTVAVTEYSYNKVEIGDYYDFVQKIVRKQYRYDQVNTPIGTFSATTGADGSFRIAFPAGENLSYGVALTTTDDAGRSFQSNLGLYSGKDYFSGLTTLTSESHGPFHVGDNISVTLGAGDETYPTGGGNRYLFYSAQNGIRSYNVGEAPSYSFQFAAEDIPNVSVVGVRFTGATYVESAYPATFAYDSSERQLNVSVTPQRASYAPGDKAGLDVKVTDKNGQPVKAEVLLSAVDEAAFRAEGDYFFNDLGILDQLYTQVTSGIDEPYLSHQYPQTSNNAEKGGGNGARDEFKDVALFQQVRTDDQGQASVNFDLPDNLTSWRVSALAVTTDLYAGSTVASVPVTLPLFVNVAMNTSYLASDQPSVKVRAFGDALKAGDPVSIEVSSPGLFDGTLQAAGTAFQATDVTLPPLREGHYDVHFKVSAGGRTDEIVRTVDVVPSRLLQDQTYSSEVRPGDSFKPQGATDRPTTVVITDHNRGRYYPLLSSLSWTYGDRVDQMLARNVAQDLMQQYFGEEAASPAEFRASAYQQSAGGIGIFPFADSDLTLSARIAALAPDKFGRPGLVAYFNKVFNDPNETRERTIIAMYGLAALGEPVLLDVQQAASLTDLSTRERLYVGLAAAQLGDDATASRMYTGLLNDFGEQRGATIRLNVGANQDDILEATSLAAGLGAMLGDDDAPPLFEYTTQNYARETLVQLEQLSYLVKAMPRLSEASVKVRYTTGGQTHDAQLERGQSVTLQLNPDELQALNLQVTEGTAGVSTSYQAPLDPTGVKTDPAVSITRAYPGESNGSVTLHDGDLVPITLTWDLTAQAVDGCYQVSDLLPSGLKPVTRLWEQGVTQTGVWYPYFVEGQRVSFCVSPGSTNHTILYYARVIGTGTYTAQPAIIQSQKSSESINLTGATQVTIQ